MGTCALCEKNNDLLESHIIPKFVFKSIKERSATGYLREVILPDVRKQDGSKVEMLCEECEKLFSRAETYFSNQIYHPFQNETIPIGSMNYTHELFYFITSVNWRILKQDLEGYKTKKCISENSIKVFEKAEVEMRQFLLLPQRNVYFENHIFFFTEVEKADEKTKQSFPNRFFRTGSFGYSFIFNETHYSVFANLAGIIIVTIVAKELDEVWENTPINYDNGSFTLPQKVQNPLFADLFRLLAETRSKESISKHQKSKIIESMKRNKQRLMESQFLKFHKKDVDLKNE